MRIHILGASGSGKTTLARKLSAALNIPHYDLDDFFWDNQAKQHNTKAEPAARDAALVRAVAQPDWIMEGIYYKWASPAFEAADVVIYLDVPRWLCQWRIIKRLLLKMILSPKQMKRGQVKALWKHLAWNHAYMRDELPKALAMVAQAGKIPARCRTEKQVCAAVGLVI